MTKPNKRQDMKAEMTKPITNMKWVEATKPDTSKKWIHIKGIICNDWALQETSTSKYRK